MVQGIPDDRSYCGSSASSVIFRPVAVDILGVS